MTYDWRNDFYEDGSPRELPDDPEEFAADATSPSPEWPAIDLEDEYDLEGVAFRHAYCTPGEAA